MNRKTIVFRMPSAEVSTKTGPTGHDQWVRRAEANDEFPPASLGAGHGGAFAIDLALERNVSEVVALSFMLPAMLGWFWWTNSVERYRRLLTGGAQWPY